MTALEEWQERVAICRKEREESEGETWQRLALWYDTWVRHNDYVERVLPWLLQRVGSTARVLEIGPGSGAFTLPLASAVREVVVVEPSPTMREVLTRNLAEAGVTNARIVPRRVEEGLEVVDGSFDLALASHSIYNVEPIDAIVRGLARLARHVVVLVDAGEQREWYRTLHRRFKGKDRIPSPHFRHLYAVLLEMGIYADVEIIWTSANYVYDSEEELVEWWAHHFVLEQDRRSALRSAILQVAERRRNHIGIYDRRRTALVWIDTERSLFDEEIVSNSESERQEEIKNVQRL
ncbi:MAG: class I SAM-dependent methyltransferase [Chloroflexota bacterium]|nr:class I SAM-dependent methyltransferase [Chloroflexota bacterium]